MRAVRQRPTVSTDSLAPTHQAYLLGGDCPRQAHAVRSGGSKHRAGRAEVENVAQVELNVSGHRADHRKNPSANHSRPILRFALEPFTLAPTRIHHGPGSNQKPRQTKGLVVEARGEGGRDDKERPSVRCAEEGRRCEDRCATQGPRNVLITHGKILTVVCRSSVRRSTGVLSGRLPPPPPRASSRS